MAAARRGARGRRRPSCQAASTHGRAERSSRPPALGTASTGKGGSPRSSATSPTTRPVALSSGAKVQDEELESLQARALHHLHELHAASGVVPAGGFTDRKAHV